MPWGTIVSTCSSSDATGGVDSGVSTGLPRCSSVTYSSLGEIAGLEGPRLRLWSGDGLRLDLALELKDGVKQGLGTWRAARYVDIDRHHLVHPLDDGVVVEHASAGGAGTHRDDPLRLWHLVIDLPQNGGHLLADAPGNDHQVGLPGRGAENLGAKAGHVELGAAGSHHLDGAAGQPKQRRPHRVVAAPGNHLVDAGGDEVVAHAGGEGVSRGGRRGMRMGLVGE